MREKLDSWWDFGVPNRREIVHDGPRTVIVLAGRPATGRTTIARHLARTYQLVPVDADVVRRGIAVENGRFSRCYRDLFIPVDEDAEPDWLRTLTAASLTSQLLCAEIMDQGFDTVTCGLVDVYDRTPDHWKSVMEELLSPHRIFGVRVVADEAERASRIEDRGPSSWQLRDREGRIGGLPAEDATGWEDIEVNTTSCSVGDIAQQIMTAWQNAKQQDSIPDGGPL